MLVLARRVNESIRFPELGITIDVVQLKGSLVRLGVSAPQEISILRGEIEDYGARKKFTKKVILDCHDMHAVRNGLNTAFLALAFAQKLLDAGEVELATSKISKALQSLHSFASSANDLEPPQLSALLVEDSDNEREMLADFLRMHGYQVTTVPDGLAAIEYLEQQSKPDLILMDMSMPRLDGASTILRIRENSAFDDVHIFAVSGQSPDNGDLDLEKNRVAKWFQKPVQPSQLIRSINGYMAVQLAAAN